MSIFTYPDAEALGTVRSVDTATVVVEVTDIEKLRKLQVNRLAVLQSSNPGQHLIGIIQKITRTTVEAVQVMESGEEDDVEEQMTELNLVRIALIGTLIDKRGEHSNVFQRTLETVPEIGANCFSVEGDRLTDFMRVVSSIAGDGNRLSLGHYTLDERAEAFLNGNKFFQRHAIIVGSTGSGKSWTTARVIEQVASLPNGDAIVFDIHGEYGPLKEDGIRHFRVAGPSDLDSGKGLSDGVLFLPYWLLGYEAMVSLFIDKSDSANAPNQSMVMSRAIVDAKSAMLTKEGRTDLLENFTIDSPVPFDIEEVLKELDRLNTEMVPGSRGEKQGDFHGKLSRLIQRLRNKQTDRRLGFLFKAGPETHKLDWLDELVKTLIGGTVDQSDGKGGVKIIDFSEVPSDILPLIVSLVARIVFSIQQWTDSTKRHPLAIFCDEAHLYIPDASNAASSEAVANATFERIAKEGRKYGVGLVVISQRPSEVNRTVLSQCNNLLAMRLTNGDDQAVVRRLLPDSLGGFGDLLPILDTGEAIVVGDASLLPSRIRITKPNHEPNSGTVPFWDKWAEKDSVTDIPQAVNNWRMQSMASN